MTKLWDGIARRAMLVLSVACSGRVHAQDMSAGHMKHTTQACTSASTHEHASSDTAFAALQQRGKVGMGVDQCASAHVFESTTYGGRVVYRMNSDDASGIAQIRKHLRSIAASFAKGDFTTPEFIHAGHVPGTEVMVQKQNAIGYSVRDIARGAELRMETKDAAARKAIREFMVFQQKEHRTM